MNPDIVAEQMKFAQIVNLKTAKHARFCGAARSPTRIIEITIRDVTQRVTLRPNRRLYQCASIGLILLQELTFWRSATKVGA